MKKTILAILMLISLLSLTACTSSDNISADADNGAQNQESAQSTAPAKPTTTAEQKQVKKFYPEALQSQGDEPAQGTVSISKPKVSDPMPENLEIKLYLIDKYDPGVCYGKPGPVRDEDIAGMITRNQSLANLVKTKYKLQSELDIYLKIKQIFAIQLKPISGGKYQYDFADGQCATQIYHVGEIQNIGGKISETLTSKESFTNS